MKRSTSTTIMLGVLMAGGMLLLGAEEAKAQCYGGSYVSGYSYGYAPSYVVAPAPVVYQAPAYYAPAPTYYYSRPYYSRRVVYRSHGGHHRHHSRGFSFGFGYHR